MALLEVTGISKNFGSTHVLQNISLNLEKGEALAIIGSSGTGYGYMGMCISFQSSFQNSLNTNSIVLFLPSMVSTTIVA